MRQQRADVDVVGPLRQPADELREAFPLPGDAGRKHGLWNILHAFHQLDQTRVIRGTARRKADAAIAHDDGRDTVLG